MSLKDKEPLHYNIGDLGYGFPTLGTTEVQKDSPKGDKKDGRNRRRRKRRYSGGDMETQHTQDLTPAGGKSSAMDTITSAARSTAVVLRDDVGHPFLKGAATGLGATLGIMGAVALGNAVGFNPLGVGTGK